jgi:hypothetical protein
MKTKKTNKQEKEGFLKNNLTIYMKGLPFCGSRYRGFCLVCQWKRLPMIWCLSLVGRYRARGQDIDIRERIALGHLFVEGVLIRWKEGILLP